MLHLNDLSQILKQHTWDEELNVWIGSESPLRSALEEIRVETIDLLDLFDAGDPPLEDDDVRQHVARTLRERLKTIPRQRVIAQSGPLLHEAVT
jgi:hypothetical protein